MQNTAAVGRATFRSGSGADKWIRAFVLSAVTGGVGYMWAKDSESSFWTAIFLPIYLRSLTDDEYAHSRAVEWLRRGKGPFDYSRTGLALNTQALDKTLQHPVMLGAGLDRNGECVYGCLGLGFSGVEVGTITPQKQAGNGTPRLFKMRVDECCISRAGSPNRGMAVVYHFLERYRVWQRTSGVLDNHLVGVNVGRNKVSNDLLDDAKIGVRVMSEVADYITVALPMPHLIGDNSIKSKEWFVELVESCENARAKLNPKDQKPILYKVSLDATQHDKDILCNVALSKNLDGIVVGHGTLTRPGLVGFHHLSKQNGLLYGEPIRDMSTEMISEIYKATKGKVLIIGGGGISSGEDAMDKIEAGATLLQLHSALFYGGPGVVPRIKRDLANLMDEKGYANVNEAVGKAVAM